MAISTLLLIFFTSLSFGDLCKISSESESKTPVELNIEKRLTEFAKLPNVRGDAEKMLSLLISAKSPMITNWVKLRKLDPLNNPNLVALEWDKYYSKNFIISKYPTSNKNINLDIEKVFKGIITELLNPEKINYFEKTFSNEKVNAIKAVNNFPISSEDKKILIAKISEIKLYWPIDLPSSKYSKFPLEFLDWSLAYDPHTNEINIGLNSLNYNEQSLRSAFLHEIAHSFDSCRWLQANTTEWPFQKIGECLRVIALKRDDSKLQEMLTSGKVSQSEFDFMKINLTCNNSHYPPIGIQADQLPETFADWFSAEALDASKLTKQFRQDLCRSHELNPGSSYISNKDRLNKIFLANKKIAKQLAENSQFKQCTFK